MVVLASVERAPGHRLGIFFVLVLLGCTAVPLEAVDAGAHDASHGADGSRASDASVPIDASLPEDGDSPDAVVATIAATIVSPVDVESVADTALDADVTLGVAIVGEPLTFEGTASGGVEPYAFTWRSDRDGVLGSGASAVIDATEGDHAIVLEVTDALGARGTSAPLPLHVLPATFDWSHRRRPSAPPAAGDWMTPVRYQDRCGSCWAFAALAVVEARINIDRGNPDLDVDLSEQSVIDCDTHSLGCLGGGTEQALMGYLRDVGADLESCNPFVGTDDVCIDACRDGSSPLRYRVEGTSWVAGVPGEGPTPAVRAWMQYELVTHGPIARSIVNMYGYDPATHICAAMGGDHYVAVVGYDHAARLWIAKNSWGATWNGDGYMEVAYGNCAIDVSATTIDGVMEP